MEAIRLEFLKKKERRVRSSMPWVRFRALIPVLTRETTEALTSLPLPKVVGVGKNRVNCPQNLQRVTYATLCELQNSAKTDQNATIDAIFVALFGKTPDRLGATGLQVVAVVNMVQREMERIAKLFEALQPSPSAEEARAGIEELKFGAFGIADYYAKRMGMTNHDEAFATPWARIYQCMKMDHEQGEFERRLRKIYEQKNRKK